MEWFSVLLAITTAVRGLGAGIIYDVAFISLPVRRYIGVIPYAGFARANYASGGSTYATVSILGMLLTIVVTAVAFVQGKPSIVRWATVISLVATVLAFVGTSKALPAVLSLQQAPDDEALVSKTLDRFAYWHAFSAAWQVAAFVALVVALAYQS